MSSTLRHENDLAEIKRKLQDSVQEGNLEIDEMEEKMIESVKDFFNELREHGKIVASSIIDSLQTVENDIGELKLANARLNRIRSLFFQFNQTNMRFFNQIETLQATLTPKVSTLLTSLTANGKTEFKRQHNVGESFDTPTLKASKTSI